MSREWIGAAVVLALCAGSAIAYARDHRGRQYAQGREAQPRSVRSFRVVYAWLRVTTPVAGLGALFGRDAVWLTLPPPAAVFGAGVALAIGGFTLFRRARRTLGREYAPCYDAYMPARIVVDGAYGYIRHPIYVANLAMMTGLTLATGSAWMLINTLLLGVFCVVSAVREESALWQSSPAYRRYVLDTGRFLPHLWRRPPNKQHGHDSGGAGARARARTGRAETLPVAQGDSHAP